MKTTAKVTLAAAFIVALATPLLAQSRTVPIEADATIDPNIRSETIPAMANLIRLNGYRCDSISAVMKHVFSRGFSVTCNRYNYEYELEDRGGRWVVCYKECD